MAEEEYHKYDCSCMCFFYSRPHPCPDLLAFRIVCKVGPEELWRIYSTKDPKYFEKPLKPFGTEPGCKYESNSYLPIHHLVNHSAQHPTQFRRLTAIISFLNASILESHTKFFDGIPKESHSVFQEFCR